LSGILDDIAGKLVDHLQSALSTKDPSHVMTDEKYTEMDQTLKQLVDRALDILKRHNEGQGTQV